MNANKIMQITFCWQITEKMTTKQGDIWGSLNTFNVNLVLWYA